MARKNSVTNEVEKGLKAAGVSARQAKKLAKQNVPQEYAEQETAQDENGGENTPISYTVEEEIEVNKLLDVIDGMSTVKSYVVAAVKGTQGKIVVMKNSFLQGGNKKIKFYPGLAYWNLTWEGIEEEYQATIPGFRAPYKRCFMPLHKLKDLLAEIATHKTRPSAPVQSRLLVASWDSIESKLGE